MATKGPRFDEVPTDTTGLDSNQYPMLSFHTLLTKIKLKRCSSYVLAPICSDT